MKKIVPILIIIVSVAVLGYLGYRIFNSVNVDTVEMVGEVQTVYFLGDGKDINFNGAQLEVKYGDGSVKKIPMNSKNVSVSNFSTSLAGKNTMVLSYKKHDIKVDYIVIPTGLYYVNKNTIKTYASDTVTTNTVEYNCGYDEENSTDLTTAPIMYYFENGGILKEIKKDSGNYFINDGKYDKSYSYEIIGDKIKLNLDKKTDQLDVTITQSGIINLLNTTYKYADEEKIFVKGSENKTFRYYEMKQDRTIGSVQVLMKMVDGESVTYVENTQDADKLITFEVGQTIETANAELYLKVVYSNDNFMKTTYVRICSEMFGDKQIDTSKVTAATYGIGYYQTKGFDLHYKVIAKS